MTNLAVLSLQAALVEVARDFHARGWMLGTAGNLSARSAGDAASFWITASGVSKGRLEESDLLPVRIADGAVLGQVDPRLRPSAETSIHRAVYALVPQAGACLHVHSVDACLAADAAHPHALSLPLPALEMLKGFGIREEQPDVALPLFENLLEVPAIAAAVRERFAREGPPRVPALMIRGHGPTVWGFDLQQAYHHVETLEFLMRYLARRG